AVLVGNPERIRDTARRNGIDGLEELSIMFARESPRTAEYAESLYHRWQRQGALHRDCVRQVTYDRNIFAASIVAPGHAAAMITGVTRHYSVALADVRHVIDPKPGERPIGISILLSAGHPVVIGDTAVHEMPSPEELADITVQTAAVARRLGFEPKVAL